MRDLRNVLSHTLNPGVEVFPTKSFSTMLQENSVILAWGKFPSRFVKQIQRKLCRKFFRAKSESQFLEVLVVNIFSHKFSNDIFHIRWR
jgi:hypothetical protein